MTALLRLMEEIDNLPNLSMFTKHVLKDLAVQVREEALSERQD